MEAAELIKHAKRIKEEACLEGKGIGAYAQAVEFLRNHSGGSSAFLERLEAVEERRKLKDAYIGGVTEAILAAFIEYAESGLMGEYKAAGPAAPASFPVTVPAQSKAMQFDDIFRLLDRAAGIAANDKNDPAAAAELLGSALELFLIKKTEEHGLNLTGYPKNIFICGRSLFDSKLITKQEMKNLGLWGAMLEDADQGIGDRLELQKVKAMHEGVSAFISKYSKQTS